ncbi:cyclic nucleotide-binding domain-containing protein [Chitinimonas arctica]|uniref:Cyclic nucleotide-binding domain-containing protein n=1 Tax=Chitinimonas arctica TaxID=2594795 RepID=A0A516SA07_9NEIS|nr:cyclic nucleotide-binding domain-containing protein [Chitinimonas arctica]QDQ24980.1 cyclic nucleotide-binding domain-containing protein [Chitinimonas arctica]
MELKAFLHNLPAFESYHDQYLNALIAELDVEDCPDGFVFIHQGGRDGAMFIILEGSVGIIRRDRPNETDYEVRDLRDGEIFGLLSLVDDMPAAATCVAHGPVKIAALTREGFRTLFQSAPPVCHQLQYMIAVQLARDLQEQNEYLRRHMS